MPTRKLTDAGLKNLPLPEQGQVDYFDTLLPAFGVRISYGGAKTFFVIMRVGGKGKLRRVTLGRYSKNKKPGDTTDPGLTLAEARDKARAVMDAAGRGIDPKLIRQEEISENERKAKLTFEKVSADFIEKYAERAGKPLRPSTVRDYKRVFEVVAADWREKPVSNISRRDVKALLDGMDARGASVMADRSFAYLRKFFNWCVDRDILETSPADRMRRDNHAVKRERVLSEGEIKLAWAAFESLGYPFGPLFKLLLLTGQRKSEVGGMTWTELQDWSSDKPLWDLPADRTKNRLAHLVPIVPEAKSIIDQCDRIGPHVFTTTGETPVSGFTKPKEAADAHMLVALRKVTEEAGDDPGKVGIPHWTLHDLRRTMVTHMNERLGIQPHIVEAIINHISGARAGVAGVYNRAQYLDERRAALKAWADWVQSR